MALNFNQEQYEKAKSVRLIDYLKAQGHQFEQQGKRYRHKEHDSMLINENNKWFWNSRNLYGNNAISYLKLVEGMTLPEAVNALVNNSVSGKSYTRTKKKKVKKPFVMPLANDNYRRAFAYLNKARGIDPEIISELMHQKKIYESSKYHNCAFVGFNEQGEPKHVAMWGTYTPTGKKPFKGEVESSDKTCGFQMEGTSDTVYVYEGPIDAISHATLYKMNSMDWRLDYRLALCCTWDGALERFLKSHKIQKIAFCLDDDKGGNTASDEYMKKYSDLGYEVYRNKPSMDDYNEELLNTIEQQSDDIELEL